MDLSLVCAQVRYRANFSKQQGKESCSFRVVPQHMLKLQDLELPATMADLFAIRNVSWQRCKLPKPATWCWQ